LVGKGGGGWVMMLGNYCQGAGSGTRRHKELKGNRQARGRQWKRRKLAETLPGQHHSWGITRGGKTRPTLPRRGGRRRTGKKGTADSWSNGLTKTGKSDRQGKKEQNRGTVKERGRILEEGKGKKTTLIEEPRVTWGGY